MRAIKNIIFWLATGSLLLAIVFLALPMLGGLEYRAIISGSMEPDIPVGSLVVIARVKDAKINIGDVITFTTAGDKSVTHKVVGYDLSQDAVITHGIANEEGVNEITPYKNIIGRVVFSVPVIGRLFLFISSGRGKVIAITAIVALYILSVFFETVGVKKAPEEEGDGEGDGQTPHTPEEAAGRTKGEKDPGGTGKSPPALGSWLDSI